MVFSTSSRSDELTVAKSSDEKTSTGTGDSKTVRGVPRVPTTTTTSSSGGVSEAPAGATASAPAAPETSNVPPRAIRWRIGRQCRPCGARRARLTPRL